MNGIFSTVLKWLVSYLTKRTQSVYIDDAKSDLLEVVYGVPQCSILGPKLFLIHMICVMFLVYSNVYCSRMTLFYIADSPELLSNTISQELSKLYGWLAVNKLSFNINKTNYMVFGNGRVTSDIAITIN